MSSAQTATLSAKASNSSATFSLHVNPAKAQTAGTLSVNATSISFGDVTVKESATQTIKVTAQGGALQITSATVSGTGFSLAKTTFPIALTAGQSVSLNVGFTPTSTGSDTGQISIVSNSGSTTVKLSGIAEAAATYKVDLSWNAAASSSPAVAGYDIYRAPSGSSTYQELNSSLNSGTSYTDTTVQAGETYEYYVVSVNTSGKTSSPSTTATVIVP